MTGDGALDPKVMLRRCLAWEGRQEFRKIISSLKDYSRFDEMPRLLKMNVQAALALKDEKALNSSLIVQALASSPPLVAYTMIRDIDRAGFRDLAAELLLNDVMERSHPLFLQQVRRCVKFRKPSDLLDRLLA
ncbi:MAG: hypothetical protein J7517_09795, partial [Sphingobium yanoikuyae]|nr:hypothetical protein [Sphingobium yanoikuyae]